MSEYNEEEQSHDIPAGYWLSLMCYERGMRNQSSRQHFGLTENEVRFLLSIATQFTMNGTFANQPIEWDDLFRIVDEAHAAYPKTPNIERLSFVETLETPKDPHDTDYLDEYYDYEERKAGVYYEWLCTVVLGYPDSTNDGLYCRTFQSYSLYHIPVTLYESSGTIGYGL
jgi:hypothetical protein